MSANDLLRTLGVTQQHAKQQPAYRLATIPSGYTSGNPTLIFDGEGSASTRQYPCVSSYVPVANDRVVVAMIGHGGLVLGKIQPSSMRSASGFVEYSNAYIFSAPTVAQFIFLGRLPISSGGTYDKIRIEVIGSQFTTPGDMINDWMQFSNRNGFAYLYKQQGNGSHTSFIIRTYSNSDGSVDVYGYSPASAYNAPILKVIGMDLDNQNAPYALGSITTTVPTGTISFDSSTSATNV